MEKAELSYDAVDMEKAIKILFQHFSFLMVDTLSLEIPKLLPFNPEEQQAAQERFKRNVDKSYQIFQKYYGGYLSPQQRYSQAFQDLKNITLLIQGEYFANGGPKISTLEVLLKKLNVLPNFTVELN